MSEETVSISSAELAELRAAKEALGELSGSKKLEAARETIRLHQEAEAANRPMTVAEALLAHAKERTQAQSAANGGYYGLAATVGGSRGGLLGTGA